MDQQTPFTLEFEFKAKEVIDSAFCVHRKLGPGLLESIYEKCMIHEIRKRGLKVESQIGLPIEYDGQLLDGGLRLDLRVEDRILIEINAIEALLPIHEAQILSYMKLSKSPLGFLINFNVPLIKHGIKRFIRHHQNKEIPNSI